MKHCWLDHGSKKVVHDWAKKKRWKAEKAWLCFTNEGLRKLSFRSGDAGEVRSELSQCVQIDRPCAPIYVEVENLSMIKSLGGVEAGSFMLVILEL
ncbi:hypothetical protein LXL04_003820 [Taraxacum kok-saghyz]